MSTEASVSRRHGRGRRRLLTAGIVAVTVGFLISGMIVAFSVHSTSLKPHVLQAQATPKPGTPEALDDTGRARASQSARGTTATSLPEPVIADIGASGSFLTVPALSIRASLIPTGAMGAPGTASLIIPADIHEVGWWDGTVQDGTRTIHENAPAPGQPGVALIAGHVDSAGAGPGALHNLAALKVGDTIEISDSARQVSIWIVDAVPQTNLKTELPPALWVTTGAPKLALVTCGGPFNTFTGHYQDNVIVWARQVN
jgi:hypothetical protein